MSSMEQSSPGRVFHTTTGPRRWPTATARRPNAELSKATRWNRDRLGHAEDAGNVARVIDEAGAHEVDSQPWVSWLSGSTCTVPASCAPGVSGISCRPPADRRRRNHTRPPTDVTPAAITVGHIST